VNPLEQSKFAMRPLVAAARVQLGRMLQPEPMAGSDLPTQYLRAANVQNGHLSLDDVKEMYCSPREVANLSLSKGDLLVCEGGDVGRVALVDTDFDVPMIYQNSVHRLIPGPYSDSRYLSYVLQAVYLEQSYYSVLCNGSTIRHLTVEKLQRLRIPVPGLADQRRIANFLDDQVALLDRAVILRQQQGILLDEQHEAEVERRLRPEGSRTPEVPARYLVERIGVGIVIQPAALYSEMDDAVPAVRGKDVSPGRIAPRDDLIRISAAGHLANQRSALRSGDIVVVRSGKAGAAAQVPDALVGCNSVDVVIVRPGGRLDSRYTEYSINCRRAQESISEYSTGAIQRHFGVEDMKALPIVPRDRVDQAVIGRELDARSAEHRRLTALLESSTRLLRERKQALITAAVTGEFDVTTARRVTADV
jgi:type I restriction enzyme S subunit